MSAIAGPAGAAAGFLGIALLVAIVAERVRIPAAVALVAFGAGVTAFHPVTLPFRFGDALLFLFLPPLIFEAAWNVDLAALRRVARPVLWLAFPGVLVVAAAVAGTLAAGGILPLAAAAVLGAICAPTDPVAVIAIFRRLHVPLDLQTLVESESVANDGVAIVLYGIAVAIAAAGGRPAPGGAGRAGGGGVVAIVGGAALGAVAARLVAFVLSGTHERAIVVAATVVLAFLTYLIADRLGLSGVFATAAAALVLHAADPGDDIDAFWGASAFIVNAIVFLATGLQLQVQRIAHEPLLVIVTVVVVVVSRVVLARLIVPPAWRTTVVLAGMRGGLSLALALALPEALPQRAEIIDAVFGVVLFTLVAQGFALGPVLRRQSGSGGPPLSS